MFQSLSQISWMSQLIVGYLSMNYNFFLTVYQGGSSNIRLLLGLRIINNNTWVMPGSGLILVEGYLILMRCKRKVRAGAGRLRYCFADASTAQSQFCQAWRIQSQFFWYFVAKILHEIRIYFGENVLLLHFFVKNMNVFY